ncbi:ornithine cyclodeaminase family protein, partial [Pseudomonas ogarae]
MAGGGLAREGGRGGAVVGDGEQGAVEVQALGRVRPGEQGRVGACAARKAKAFSQERAGDTGLAGTPCASLDDAL